MQNRTKQTIGVVIVAIVAVLSIRAMAQGLGASSGGSLAELTAAVRELRAVIQQAGRDQTQMQALNISLTAQQSRLQQVSGRLDAVQEELRKAAAAVQQTTESVGAAQEIVSSLPANATAQERANAADTVKEFRAVLDRAIQEESAARTRQAELMNSFRAEEARWIELVAKLEAIVKR